MDIRQQVSLAPYNTMALVSEAEYYCEAHTEEELREALAYARDRRLPVSLLGGGSNVILAPRVAGLVIRILVSGVVTQRDESEPGRRIVEAGAGENWHRLVMQCLDDGMCGLENLALIPGNCGSAPIQNIGAYGVELDSVFHSLDALDMETGERVIMQKADCGFSYRDSIFKHKLKGRMAITRIRLRLSAALALRTDYPALQEVLQRLNPDSLTPALVAQTVCDIRRSKLPDPEKVPNVGSFFKNPVVDVSTAEALRTEFPGLVSYPASPGKEKLAAAWLIDQAGWKGRCRGGVGVHDRQALVLVNAGDATGETVLALAEDIARSVQQRYRVTLEMEPQRIGW